MTPPLFWQPLQNMLEQYADADRAAQMSKYMRNQFTYYGIDAKTIKNATSVFNKLQQDTSSLKLQARIDWTWQQPQREWQYIGQQQLYRWRKEIGEQDHTWLTDLSLTKSWWDSIDFLASNVWGYYFQAFPHMREQLIPQWIRGNQMWLKRIAILFQLKYKAKTDLDWLLYAIEPLKEEKEFFIRKAIGWALRQYAKTDADWVRRYVSGANLSGLSEREALKNLT